MAERRQTANRWFGRGGSVLVVVTLFLPVMLAFTVATVDVGYFYAQKSRVQAAADMACLSALGNVTWWKQDVSTERSQMTSIFQNTLVQNGYPADFLGTPTFPATAVRNNNQERIDVIANVPVRTFFWDFIRPGDPNLVIQIRSAAGVTYEIAWEPVGGNWGIYAKSGIAAAGTYSAEAYGRSYAESSGWVMGGAAPPVDTTDPDRYLDIGTATSAVVDGNIGIIGNLYAHEVATIGPDAEILVDSSNSLYDDTTGFLYAETLTIDSGNLNIDPNKVNDGYPGPQVIPDLPPTPAFPAQNHDVGPDGQPALRYYDWDNGSSSWVEVTPIPNSAYDPATGKLKIGNGKKLVIKGGGQYNFSSLDFAANSAVEIDWVNPLDANATTQVFHTHPTESFNFNGQFASYNKFQVITNTTGTITVNGGSTFYADILAPNALVKHNGGADFYGRIYADSVQLGGGGTFYFDTDLPAWGGQQSTPPQVIVPCHLIAN